MFLCVQVGKYWIILKLRRQQFPFASDKVFPRNKKRCVSGIPASFIAWFLKNYVMLCYLCDVNLPNLIFWLPLLFEIERNIFIVIICVQCIDRTNFAIYYSCLSKLFSYISKNVRTKMQKSSKEKYLPKWNEKHYSTCFLKEIKQNFWGGQSLTLNLSIRTT